MERKLVELESLKSRLSARQVELVRAADERQVPTRDGCSTLKEWMAGRLDVAPTTAAELAHLARSEPGSVEASWRRVRCRLIGPRLLSVW